MEVLFEKDKKKIVESIILEDRNDKQAEKEVSKVKQKRKRYELFMKTVMYTSTLLTGALVIFLLSYVLIKGIPNLFSINLT